MDLSILVVSFNTRELTLQCLASVAKTTAHLDCEVLIADNASDDGSPAAIRAAFASYALFALEENVGFGKANNLLATHAKGQYLLLLNPDACVQGNAVESMLSFARANGGAGIFGGRTLNPDGSLNPASCWGRITPWSSICEALGLSSLFRGNAFFDPESLGPWKRDSVRTVDIVSGCFFLVDRGTWDRLGGFDPVFFMYGEDADFCLRARALGILPLINPDARVVHVGGASETVRADKIVRLLRARVQLLSRHWKPILAKVGIAAVVGRAASRSLFWRLLSLGGASSARERFECWQSVWVRRKEWTEMA